MKVLIHALGATMGGGLRHLSEFLPELARLGGANEYVVLVRASVKLDDAGGRVTLRRLPDRNASSGLQRLWKDVVALPKVLSSEHFSVAVSLTNFGPIRSPIPHAVFQRNALYFDASYGSRCGIQSAFAMWLRKRWLVESMKRADVIVTPTNAMAEMIRQSVPSLTARRYCTMYHGFNAELAPRQPAIRDDGIYRIIYPSHLAAHKGFDVLLRATSLLARERKDVRLALTIDRRDEPKLFDECKRLITDLAIGNVVEILGRIPQERMKDCLACSDLMVFPSLCESFGFPLLEGMGAGLPIVAADTPTNREVAGRAAVYYMHNDPAHAAAKLSQVLGSAGIRDELRKGGAERLRATDWSWDRYARDFEALVSALGSPRTAPSWASIS